MSQVKRQLNHTLQSQEQYEHQYDLQTIGMRIRQAVSNGYQNQTSHQIYNQQHQQQQEQPSVFQKVPLPSNVVTPPLLSNATSSSFGSSFEEWEQNLDQRLNTIDERIQKDSSFGVVNKRGFECVDGEF